MPECLGLYIENNLIKYAKVSKERENIKVETFGVKVYDKLEDSLKQIIQETYSYKTPISVNLSDEMYNYFEIFSMLNKKDIERAIKTEFDFLCEERGFNKNTLEARYFSVSNMESKERLKTIHISANRTEIARKTQQLEGYKLRNISPLPISIVNLIDTDQKQNIAIVNIEEKTTITIIINQQIYKVDVLESGMKEIFQKINVRQNSYSRAYETCKNTTIYTADSKNLQLEESQYLEEIMPTLYSIVSKTKEIIVDSFNIEKIYISGTGAIINNIDLYFQENFRQIKCEILRPYFIQPEAVRVNIKDYIEVNSAIALALQELGDGLKNINFKEISIWDKIELPEITGLPKFTNKIKLPKFSFSLDLTGGFDKVEKAMLRFGGTIIFVILLYSLFSFIIANQIQAKQNEVSKSKEEINKQIELVDNDINKIRTRISEYSNLTNKLKAVNEKTTEKFRTRNAIPNLLNRIMTCIPKNVQLTSIANTAGTHIVIKAQSEQYEQLGMFKAQISVDHILNDVKSDSGVKQDGIVKVTIEGDLP